MHALRRDPQLSRLVHSVLWPGFVGTRPPSWILRALEEGLGGVVYFANNIDNANPAQVGELSASIHAANPDALIGVDEEGGNITRLEVTTGSSMPGNAVLGRIDDINITEQAAARIGRLVGAAGIDVDIAPTVDVNSNPANPVIGVRSFGADSAVVARHARAYVRGIQGTGVAACAKHFPGHGDTVTDSHLDVATSDISIEVLRSVHLPPFVAAIEAGVRAIMTAHIRIPALGESPATINKRSLSILRELGFDGVLITDALDMAAIRARIGTGPGAVAALNAGADLICIGNPTVGVTDTGEATDELSFREPLEAIYAALQQGELSTARLEGASARTAALAAWRREQPDVPPVIERLNGAALAERAALSIGDVRLKGSSLLVIDGRARPSLANGATADFFTVALRRRKTVERVSLGELSEAEGRDKIRQALVASSDDVVLLVNQPQSSRFEAAMLGEVLAGHPDAVVIYAGWPAAAAPPAARALFTFGTSQATAHAAAAILCGV